MDSAAFTHNEKAFTLFKYLNVPWTGQRCVLIWAPRQSIPGRYFQKQVVLSLCYPSPCVCTASFTMNPSQDWDSSTDDKQQKEEVKQSCPWFSKGGTTKPQVTDGHTSLIFPNWWWWGFITSYPCACVQSPQPDTWLNTISSLAIFFHQHKWQTPL